MGFDERVWVISPNSFVISLTQQFPLLFCPVSTHCRVPIFSTFKTAASVPWPHHWYLKLDLHQQSEQCTVTFLGAATVACKDVLLCYSSPVHTRGWCQLPLSQMMLQTVPRQFANRYSFWRRKQFPRTDSFHDIQPQFLRTFLSTLKLQIHKHCLAAALQCFAFLKD